MGTLQAIYVALAVFGLGVTIVDLFGALDHGDAHTDGHADGHSDGHADGHSDGHADGHGDGHSDGHADGHGEGHDLGDHGAEPASHAGHDGHDGHGGQGFPLDRAETSLPYQERNESTGMSRSASVARLISWLRTGVYFSLGAGATGLAGLAMKVGAVPSALWAAGAGVAIAVFVRLLRRFVRRDLDSSFKSEDFILEEAEITVPVAPGFVGRAIVKKYGAQSEVYVKAAKPDAAFARGTRVRIVDCREDCYLVEALDEALAEV